MIKKELLKKVFGYDAFRPGQEEIIDGILSGRDVFGIMPTGGGKSICYQLPGILQPGITIVISPLISLMRDQVMALKEAGISAAYINSTLNAKQISLVYRNLLSGMYKIVYVAPERLDYPGFSSVAERLNISLIAVDEAHCISQWGQDFRPSYLRILNFVASLPRRPVLGAFTATATQQVKDDIERILMLHNPVRVVTGYDRPNLSFDVLRPKNKDNALLQLLSTRKRKSGIVYCSTRKAVESVCQLLNDKGFRATRYHAGLEDEERTQNQEEFIHDRKTIMVATNAFGMGIDKSNVSYVIHYNMPKSIEAYYQEAGRAGRDGSAAECILLYADKDVQTARYLIDSSSENEEMDENQLAEVKKQDYRRLASMVGFCKTNTCLRGYILEYFGEKHGKVCGNCGTCRGEYERIDITSEAQIILSCVIRIRGKLGYTLGITTVAKILQGSREKRILELELNKLPTFGLMKDMGRTEIRAIADQLETDGYLQTDPEHQGVIVTPEAEEILYKGKKVSMLRIREATEELPNTSGKKHTKVDDPDLFEALRVLRRDLAKDANIPPYAVFTDATLAEMVSKKPRTLTEFRRISGVGELKASWYAKPFLERISEYLASEAID